MSVEHAVRLLEEVERVEWRAPDPDVRSVSRPGGVSLSRKFISKFKMKEFGPALPCGFGLSPLDFEDVSPGLAEDFSSALESPLDETVIHRLSGAPRLNGEVANGIVICRVKEVTHPKEVGGLVRQGLPRMWKKWEVLLDESGAVTHQTLDVYGGNQSELFLLTKGRFPKFSRKWREAALPGEYLYLRLAATTQLSREYAWHVEIGRENGLRLSLPTDADGARALLRDRDVSPGERRKSLLHWVSGHYRKRRPPSEPAFVRAHMRGTEDASWSGLPVRVRPAAADVRLVGR